MMPVRAADAVAKVWIRFQPTVSRWARRLTRDRDLRQDLMQEAVIALWESDPTRFDLRDRAERAYLLRVMANRMRDVWRAEMKRCTRDDWMFAPISGDGSGRFQVYDLYFDGVRCRRPHLEE